MDGECSFSALIESEIGHLQSSVSTVCLEGEVVVVFVKVF